MSGETNSNNALDWIFNASTCMHAYVPSRSLKTCPRGQRSRTSDLSRQARGADQTNEESAAFFKRGLQLVLKVRAGFPQPN